MFLINIEKMFSSFESVYVSPAQAKRFQNGGALDINRIKKKLENKVYILYIPVILDFSDLENAIRKKANFPLKDCLLRRD